MMKDVVNLTKKEYLLMQDSDGTNNFSSWLQWLAT